MKPKIVVTLTICDGIEYTTVKKRRHLVEQPGDEEFEIGMAFAECIIDGYLNPVEVAAQVINHLFVNNLTKNVASHGESMHLMAAAQNYLTKIEQNKAARAAAKKKESTS